MSAVGVCGWRALAAMLLGGVMLLTSGCASHSQWPSAGQWRDSALSTAKSPATWVPLLAAGAIHVAGADQRLSDYAHENHPVFGSDQGANDVADGGIQALSVLAVGSALLAPTPADNDWTDQAERVAVLIAAHSAADGTTGWLKGVFDRQRPNGHQHSFPSGHATEAFAYATEAARNIDDYGWSPSQQLWWDIGVYSLASSVAWARVEAQGHYPTDVLAGAAVGHFISGWLYDAYLKTSFPDAQLVIEPSRDGFWLEWRGRF
ncbi:phosphatase PAP2 family protein [Permianibacter sp. IMCC34836]|uniref:phosphatase PAP2 family protein n=1 Tax=Permianibacter fluminis TaxID=2738515 RepID=UPI00155604B7|nr:phosphatase PAP2 family protein [Permianibacter fluminis]NQD36830.1 phosphatase PAP2 family protein [Permianibacter fluminis]